MWSLSVRNNYSRTWSHNNWQTYLRSWFLIYCQSPCLYACLTVSLSFSKSTCHLVYQCFSQHATFHGFDRMVPPSVWDTVSLLTVMLLWVPLSLQAQLQQQYQYLVHLLQEERYKSERLQEQLTDLTDLHQSAISNVQQEVAAVEERLDYRGEERLRDLQEHLEKNVARVSCRLFIAASWCNIYVEGQQERVAALARFPFPSFYWNMTFEDDGFLDALCH